MSDRRKELGRDVVGLAVPPFVAAIAQHLGVPPELFAGVTVAGGLFGLLGYDSLSRRSESFVAAFRRDLHEANQGDFDATVRERAADPQFRNTTYHALRQLRDAMDDVVAPAIGILLRDYTVPRTVPIDSFFRALGDLLSSLSADEYEDLEAVIDSIWGPFAVDDGHHRGVLVTFLQGTTSVFLTGTDARGELTSRQTRVTAPSETPAILATLQRFGLAEARPDRIADRTFARSHEPTIAAHVVALGVLDLNVLRRLRSVLSRAAEGRDCADLHAESERSA